jgi:molybdopterin-containing oxidoreductase family membrane subunit
MLENALYGSRKYWGWIFGLLAVMAVGAVCYIWQYNEGLGITGLSRDVSWGFYIAQFTFLVGVAASAVMVVLPYYLHNYKAFAKITILGEFLAISAVSMCVMFIFVDMGQPFRLINMFLHPSPKSMMLWDTVALNGYLVLNVLISYVTLRAERKSVAPPNWIRPVIILSIPWAVSIHTVTAFLYCGLGGRPFWFTAILAPRFLASAFASGPALLIIVCLLLKKLTRFDAGKEPIQKLAIIAAYAMSLNVFFIALEFFTAFYSANPEHTVHLRYLYFGVGGGTRLVPFMWISTLLALVALILLLVPGLRKNERILTWACSGVFVSIWIDKGMGMVVGGFVPNPLGKVVEYAPTAPELLISLSIYATGLLIITVLYKIALSVRGQLKF